jgi:outer membrane immunogenic protein
MRKILLSGAAFALLAVGPALAADLPRKAPVYQPPPPPPAIWNGWYVGLNAGAGWNNNDFDNVQSSTFCNTGIFGTGGCNTVLPFFTRGAPVAFGSDNKAGFIGGGQIGYNYQAPGSVWVWGVETDFQGADIKRAGAVTNTVNIVGPINLNETGVASQRLNMLGTLRGRLGWTPSAPWLLYVTGGLAYGHLETSVGFSQHISGLGVFSPFFPDRSTFISKDDWRAGWTVGGGVEWMFAPRWSFKAEYLYYDLGHQNFDSQLDTVLVVGGTTTRLVGIGIASEASNKGSIARAGINYHFGAY